MKKFRSLVAAFTLAAASMAGLATSAQAQTVSVTPQGDYYGAQQQVSVSQQAINDVAYNIGVQTAYYRAGVGFTDAYASTGEHIGLEFALSYGQASVVRAYNMNNPSAAAQFGADMQNAAITDARLGYANPYGYDAHPRYEVVAPVAAIVGLGWIIHDINRDHHRHDGYNNYNYNRHYNAPRYDGYRHNDNGRHQDTHQRDNRNWNNRGQGGHHHR